MLCGVCCSSEVQDASGHKRTLRNSTSSIVIGGRLVREVRAIEIGLQALQLLVPAAKQALLPAGQPARALAVDGLHVREGVQQRVIAQAPACTAAS